MTVTLIWAQTQDGVIGTDGGIPWHLPEDARHFRALTSGGTVIMGRKTWESLPERFRPLPGRRNIVMTRDASWHADGAERAASLEAAAQLSGDQGIWVIGGAEIYSQAIGTADALEVTVIDTEVPGDAHAPVIGSEWMPVPGTEPNGWLTSRAGTRYRFISYVRR